MSHTRDIDMIHNHITNSLLVIQGYLKMTSSILYEPGRTQLLLHRVHAEVESLVLFVDTFVNHTALTGLLSNTVTVGLKPERKKKKVKKRKKKNPPSHQSDNDRSEDSSPDDSSSNTS